MLLTFVVRVLRSSCVRLESKRACASSSRNMPCRSAKRESNSRQLRDSARRSGTRVDRIAGFHNRWKPTANTRRPRTPKQSTESKARSSRSRTARQKHAEQVFRCQFHESWSATVLDAQLGTAPVATLGVVPAKRPKASSSADCARFAARWRTGCDCQCAGESIEEWAGSGVASCQERAAAHTGKGEDVESSTTSANLDLEGLVRRLHDGNCKSERMQAAESRQRAIQQSTRKPEWHRSRILHALHQFRHSCDKESQ